MNGLDTLISVREQQPREAPESARKHTKLLKAVTPTSPPKALASWTTREVKEREPEIEVKQPVAMQSARPKFGFTWYLLPWIKERKFILTHKKGCDKVLRLRNWCRSGSVQFFGQRFECPAWPSGCPEIGHYSFLDVVSWVGRKFLQFRQVHSIPILNCSFIICLCLLLGARFVSCVKVTPIERKLASFTLPYCYKLYNLIPFWAGGHKWGGGGGCGHLTTHIEIDNQLNNKSTPLTGPSQPRCGSRGGEMGEFSPPFFWAPFSLFFSYPSNTSTRLWFYYIITKIHPPFQNPGSAPAATPLFACMWEFGYDILFMACWNEGNHCENDNNY